MVQSGLSSRNSVTKVARRTVACHSGDDARSIDLEDTRVIIVGQIEVAGGIEGYVECRGKLGIDCRASIAAKGAAGNGRMPAIARYDRLHLRGEVHATHNVRYRIGE